jgi:prenyltransferase beta subunit
MPEQHSNQSTGESIMFKISHTSYRFIVIVLTLGLLCAGSAFAKEKPGAKGKGSDFDFAKTSAFMKEMEFRPDFPVAMVLANDYVYSLISLGQKIEPARKTTVISYLKNAQQKNGGFVSDKSNKSASLLNTDIAVETLGYLNAMTAVDIVRIKAFVASVKNTDGGFGFSQESKKSSLATTFYAVHTLKAIGGLDQVDKAKTAAYVKAFGKKEGGFGSVKGTGVADARNTYMAVYVLNVLGALDAGTEKNAVQFLATTPYAGKKTRELPELNEQLYAIMALKELKESSRIDKQEAVAFLKRIYIKVNGGFGPLAGYGSTPDSTTTALRILAEIGKLKAPIPAGTR